MRTAISVSLFVTLACLATASAEGEPNRQAVIRKIETLGGRVEYPTGKSSVIETVSFVGCTHLTNDDLKVLGAIPELKELLLAGATGISDGGLKHVIPCKGLQSLGLTRTAVTDVGMSDIAQLKNLEHLQLCHTSISDKGVVNLHRLPKLKSIVLAGTQVTDAGLKELAAFPSLTTIDVKQSRVTAKGLSWLRSSRPTLEFELPFIVRQNNQPNNQPANAATEPRPSDNADQKASRQGTKTSEEEVTPFRERLPAVQAGPQPVAERAAKFQPADGDSAEMIQAAEKIISIGGELRRQGAQNSGPVVGVVLLGAQKLQDKDLDSLKQFPDLTFLAIGAPDVSNDGVKRIVQYPKLQILILNGTRVDDDGLKEVAKMKQLLRLRVDGPSITDRGVMNLERLPNLQAIMLPATAVTDKALKELAEFQNLKLINVAGTGVTEAGAKWLRDARPDIQLMQGAGQQGGGGQRADPDFDVRVVNPAYPTLRPRILFDEAHQNFHTASGRYKPFAQIMTNDGYTIIPGTRTFTADLLASFHILIVANATSARPSVGSAFTPDECKCVKDWVDAGGSLLLVTDHEPFGSASEELANLFGVDMGCRVVTDPESETGNGLLFSRENLQVGNHPIMQGRDASERVDRVLTFSGQMLKGPPGSWQLLRLSDTAFERNENNQLDPPSRGSTSAAVVSGSNRCQGLALKSGRGRVVVMGEAAALSAQVVGGNPLDRFGMNVPGCDNRKMAMNIMHWLSRLIDPD